MANSLYVTARKKFLGGQLVWHDVNNPTTPTTSTNIYAILCDNDGTFSNIGLDTQTSVITACGATGSIGALAVGNGAVRAGPVQMSTFIDNLSGAADANDVTFSAVPVGTAIEGIMIYYKEAEGGTGIPIVWIDQAAGLTITPNGGDIIVQWDSGTNKIFRL